MVARITGSVSTVPPHPAPTNTATMTEARRALILLATDEQVRAIVDGTFHARLLGSLAVWIRGA